MIDHLNILPKMKTARRKFSQFLFLTLVVWMASGCAYPISKQFREEARNQPTFPMVLNNPQAYKGSLVIWGGKIIDIKIRSEESQIIALETPLNYEEKPEGGVTSQGQFIAKTSKFLDPAIYKPGGRITVAGEIIGEETRLEGDFKYTYPVIRAKEIRIWRDEWVYAYPPDAYPRVWGQDMSQFQPYDPAWPFEDYPFTW